MLVRKVGVCFFFHVVTTMITVKTVFAFVLVPVFSTRDTTIYGWLQNKRQMRYKKSMINKNRSNIHIVTMQPSGNSDDNNILDTGIPTTRIIIEYCTGCKWNLRAFWIVQELLDHYSDSFVKSSNECSKINGITVIPSSTAGTFRITGQQEQQQSSAVHVLWDRTVDVGFPEDIHVLVERIDSWTIKADENQFVDEAMIQSMSITNPKPHISICYDASMKLMFRSTYIAQEILSTFHDEVHAISIVPTLSTNKRSFQIDLVDDSNELNNIVIWKYSTSFIPIKQMKQLIRDQINPTKDLGHSDAAKSIESIVPKITSTNNSNYEVDEDSIDTMDDDQAEQARKFFGVL